MNFDFSDEQQQLREAIEQFLDKEYPFERLRAAKGSAAAWDPAVWQGLAELGVTAINVPSSLGGLGYGPMETLVLMGACGPSLLLEPVLTSIAEPSEISAPDRPLLAIAEQVRSQTARLLSGTEDTRATENENPHDTAETLLAALHRLATMLKEQS